VTPKDLGKIKVGDPVELTADSAPGRVFQGKISHISSGSDETTRAVYLRAPLKNPEGVLKTNSYVRGSIITEVRHQKLTVPEGALQEHMGRPTLYVALPATGAFEVRHVKLGAKGDRWREISEGLKAGENVAVSGTFYLKSEALKSSLSDGCCGGD
jgi:multidrug efflux pump subunit AcrA (membrane-fusion protein)